MAMDASGRVNFSKPGTGAEAKTTAMSMFHEEANELGRQLLTTLGTHLQSKYGARVVGMQPTYNNEYEAKFSQEYDTFQVGRWCGECRWGLGRG